MDRAMEFYGRNVTQPADVTQVVSCASATGLWNARSIDESGHHGPIPGTQTRYAANRVAKTCHAAADPAGSGRTTADRGSS